MRKPNHIILDFENGKNINTSNYWAVDFLTSSYPTSSVMSNLDLHKKYTDELNNSNNVNMLNMQQKFTVRSKYTHDAELLRSWEKEGLTKLFKPFNTDEGKTSKYLLKYSQHKSKDAYMYINLSTEKYSQRKLKYLLSRYNKNSNTQHKYQLNTWFNNVNINFLRKERLYTKLKYSRSPAFDIVSGGAAALLAAFIGFLISEKFGYELVDSGDFYFLFMYLVFLAFSIRPLITVSDASKGFWDAISVYRVINFYSMILQLFLKKLK